MKRIIKSEVPPENKKKMNKKKEQPVRFEPKNSLWFSNPPRYYLS